MRASLPSERYGFPRRMFPLNFRGHRIQLVNNDCYVSTEGRLTFHLNLYCSRCEQEEIIRGRLRQKYQEHDNNAAIVKLRALGGFVSECDRKAYKGSSRT